MTVINGVVATAFLAPLGALASLDEGKPHLLLLEHWSALQATRQPARGLDVPPGACAAADTAPFARLAAPSSSSNATRQRKAPISMPACRPQSTP